MVSFVKSFFVDYTIAHAVDNRRIEEERQQDKNSNLFTKLKKGICVGAKGVIKALVIVNALSVLTNQFFDDENATVKISDAGFMECVIVAPIIEEIFFRGILQNGICCAQKFTKWAIPGFIKNTRAFEWLTSPSARILGAGSLFALAHLRNAGDYLSTAGAARQLGNFLLTPTSSILHETTGSIAAPIVSHMTNNFFGFCLSKIAQ